MKKTLSLLLFCLVCWAGSMAQTRKWELYELNAAADVVLRGKIASLTSSTYTFNVMSVVVGNPVGESITVQRFKDTKTVKRWAKYAVGEEMIVFLKKDGELYKVIGENGEGEKFIFGIEIYLDGRGGGLKNTFGYHAVNAKLNIYSENAILTDFIAAIKDTRPCLAIDVVDKKTREGIAFQERYFKPICDETATDAARSMGWMQDAIFSVAEKHLMP